MIVPMSRLDRIFGDRILVRKLDRPEKMRGIIVPVSCMKTRPKEQELWYGIIERFGLDSRYGDAYGLKEGDIVGINDLGVSNASFIGDDEQEHFWIMEEFLTVKDDGRVVAFRNDEKYEGVGLTPLGAYSVIKPYAEEEKRGGIHIPHTSQQESLLGRVVAVSKGEVKSGELHPLNVRMDTEVLFGKYSGIKAEFGNDKFLLIKEEDLISELSPEDKTISTGQELAHA